jgi:hypothetical protein
MDEPIKWSCVARVPWSVAICDETDIRLASEAMNPVLLQ